MSQNAYYMLLSIYNKPLLNIDEVCSIVGIAVPTGYSNRSNGTFPIKMSGSPLKADIRDVADYLDQRRKEAA